ncbi:hypothetical protein Q8A73_013032 [Channa argus]|nr:hypothetical protein Q8A73_013032 [Channa argus]
MEPVNKPSNRRRGRRKNWNIPLSPPLEHRPAVDAWYIEQLEPRLNKKGLTALHMACLYGQLSTIQLLVESGVGCLDHVDSQGHRPIHMVLSFWSSPNTSSCLRYLLENRADVNTTTDLGLSPLHIAASEGLFECTEMLVQAGADVLAKDQMGHTPLDLARVWCHRKIARYLKNCMWMAEKSKEMEERKRVLASYGDLVDMAKVNNLNKKALVDSNKIVAEWAKKKGIPVIKDLSSRVQDSSDLKYDKIRVERQPGQPALKPWAIYTGLQQVKSPAEPDLRDCVTVWRGSSSRQAKYTTEWDSTPRAAPDLPLDILERVFFPRAFPPRITLPQDFKPQSILAVQHQGLPQGRITSPWTEVAMHLVEVLEPGHY